jgi:glutamate dehydrogenase
LDESNPSHAGVLNDIKRRFREETRGIYVNFAMAHYPAADEASQLG